MKKSNLGTGIVLIAVGLVWLISIILDIRLPLLSSFFKLWPLLFIAIGFSIIFTKKKIFQTLIWAMYFLILIVYSIFSSGAIDNGITRGQRGSGMAYTHTEQFVQGTQNASIRLETGGAFVDLGMIRDELFKAEIFDEQIVFDIDRKTEPSIYVYSKQKSRSISDLSQDYSWDIKLGSGTVWDVRFDMGAVEAYLDFRGITVNDIDINTGASKLLIYFSDEQKDSDVTINAGASDIELYFSKNTGVRIRQQGILASNNYTEAGFEKREDHYYSQNYDQASNRIDIKIEIGIGAIEVGFYD